MRRRRSPLPSPGRPQGEYRTGLRDGRGEALGLGVAPEIRKYRAAGIIHRGEYLPHGAGVKGPERPPIWVSSADVHTT